MTEIIIIGAGVAGLMAAKELSSKGYKVTILEADNRIGGRIHTITNQSFTQPVEAGAEFIHGKLPCTLKLLKEAGIAYHPVAGAMIRVKNGVWQEQDELITGWDELMQRMNAIKEDMTIAAFLEQYFNDEKFESMRRSVKSFAEGYDLADTSIASLFALRDEWMHEEDEQYRIDGGYIQLVSYLEKQCKENGCIIHTSSIVKQIHWQKNKVTITTADNKTYKAIKIIITLPLGILQADATAKASVNFIPSIDEYLKAIHQVGFGAVIKILLEFKEAFYTKQRDDIGFVLSNEIIPTWWTQYSSTYPLLTGWVGGERAIMKKDLHEEEILQLALESLSNIFKINISTLKNLLTAWHIAKWQTHEYALGGYSYNTLFSEKARSLLNTALEDTIFFAGEAIYEGSYPGTVEAALVSGSNVAGKIMG